MKTTKIIEKRVLYFKCLWCGKKTLEQFATNITEDNEFVCEGECERRFRNYKNSNACYGEDDYE